ncbi:hypothetical protein E9993_18505 [Labilibacter sediminis]|nr:hypothetical protein E9993_18505 [Labilibacter sediminis]
MKIKVLIIFLINSLNVFSVELYPIIKNYSPRDYNSGNQIWSITQDSTGRMYFGHNSGLLMYDGIRWENYEHPEKNIIRSVECADLKIYAGSYESFGYWSHTNTGALKYKELGNHYAKNIIRNVDVWDVIAFNDTVLFKAADQLIYCCDNKIDVIHIKGNSHYFFKSGTTYYTYTYGEGLYVYRNGLNNEPELFNFFKDKIISSIQPTVDGVIISTISSGIFVVKNGVTTIFSNKYNDFFIKNQVTKMVLTDNGELMVGTRLNGLVVFDLNGNFLWNVNKQNGLQNNTVLSLYIDYEKNLWIGTEEGIDYINLKKPFRIFNDLGCRLGTIFTIAKAKKNLQYLGTNHGIFELRSSDNIEDYEEPQFIEGSQGFVLQIKNFDDQIIACHNEETYLVGDGGLKRIFAEGINCIQKYSFKGKDYLIAGNQGLVIFKKELGEWILKNRVEGFYEPIRFIEIDEFGNIWTSGGHKGIYQVRLDDKLEKCEFQKFYGVADGFPNENDVNVFKIRNHIVFNTQKGFYYFNMRLGRIEPFERLNLQLGTYKNASQVFQFDLNTYWFYGNNKYSLIEFYPNSFYIKNKSESYGVPSRMLNGYENVVKISPTESVICMTSGFLIHNIKSEFINEQDTLDKTVYFNKISFSNRNSLNGKAYNATENFHSKLEFPFKSNVSLDFYCNSFDSDINFITTLEGLDSEWSKPSRKADYEFQRLPHGDYSFKVKVVSKDNVQSSEFSYSFRIEPPWYASRLAYFIYFIGGVAMLVLFRYLFLFRLKKKERILKEANDKRLEEERLENEKILMRMRNEKLRSEVELKNKELVKTTMSVIENNEVLDQIKNEIEKNIRGGLSNAKELNNKILKIINQTKSDGNYWDKFKYHFNKRNENLFKALKVQFPDLSSNDLYMCAYLQLNLSTKDIATLENISIKGVEVRRYRLRKKLKIDSDVNLSSYIMEISQNI